MNTENGPNGQLTDNQTDARAPELSVCCPPHVVGTTDNDPDNRRTDIARFVGFRNYTKQNGSVVPLTVFERLCRECRAPFEFTSAVGGEIAIDLARLTVRCPACRPQRKRKLKPEGEQL